MENIIKGKKIKPPNFLSRHVKLKIQHFSVKLKIQNFSRVFPDVLSLPRVNQVQAMEIMYTEVNYNHEFYYDVPLI